ncbi:hypothetical protein [Sphaerisporangium corydalis]|uniref:Uncharacterized protein n=1 Tax=Sphaerisporangium corydalis TaxID=1441875 RepID=A0ABV9E7B7_9ACTN|nr:hypothetical protein [Sphaerisporangium corydalis]
MSNAMAAVRALPVRAASTCPWWCEREHPSSYTTHMADIAELRTAGGFTVQITIVQHVEPGRAGEQVVRLFTCADEDQEGTVSDLAPGAADAMGSSIIALSPHGSGRAYGVALRRAAAHLLPQVGDASRARRAVPVVRLVERPAVRPVEDPPPGEGPSGDELFRLGYLTGYLDAAKIGPGTGSS